MNLNIIDKIWANHVVEQKENFPNILYIDKILLHEVTSSQAFDELEARGIPIRNPQSIIATIDHSIPTDSNRENIKDPIAKIQVDTLRVNAKKFNIKLYDINSSHQGIVHVIGPELGFTTPGATIICGDSHTATHGAFGALAFGVGTSEIGHALASSCILEYKPKTFKVEFIGTPKANFTSKDAILKLIATIGIGGAQGYIIEYTGSYIQSLSMEQRMTICNMSIECGARSGLIAPDETTFNYLNGKEYVAKGDKFAQDVERWKRLVSDNNAKYDKQITIDITDSAPYITWGINPEHAISLDSKTPSLTDARYDQETLKKAYSYTQLEPNSSLLGVKIDYAFIGSCTNGRIEDLRVVANVLKGSKIAKHVTMIIVPGSEQVLLQAQKEGLDTIFKNAGADFRLPGCSMCLAMNPDHVPPGKRCISSTNRNFIGRQGANSITHLASPYTVAISAINGCIAIK
ncbi:MAG: 3-isopropylmalate dehydratase large subunit [Pseudomonadota bacterium]|jgi:3-isopropylmalate/(R)-2-methylmalate dehydratase large subunit|nr:3-isopropylmalate dehydratase large subunit [Burkholderiales bacterium]